MENPLAEDLDLVLSRTEKLWEEVRGKKIFITGGTGFFGCWLLETFCHANRELSLKAQAVVLSRNPAGFGKKCPHLANDSGIRLVKGSIGDFDFPAGPFTYVIHAAVESTPAAGDGDALQTIIANIDGTRRVLDFARKANTEKLLLTSSGAVYGRQPAEIKNVPEEYTGAPDTMNPLSAYGEGKRAAEFLCAESSRRYGFEAKIARCFAFVGPYLPLDRNFAIGNFIRDGLQGGPIHITGDGSPYRSYLYAAELAEWLWKILFRGKSCYPYNVGSDKAVSIADLAKEVAACFEKRMKIIFEKKKKPGMRAERYVPSIERIKQDLNVRQTISLKEAIRRTIRWNKEAGFPEIHR